MIVAIEGIDGAGKTTQAHLLASKLKARLFKFPNPDSPTGKMIYEHLHQKWSCTRVIGPPVPQPGPEWIDKEHVIDTGVNALVFQSLQLANRMETVSEIIAASKKVHVVIDRWWQSGYAYGREDGIDPEYLIHLHNSLPQPDINILIEVTAEESMQRLKRRSANNPLDYYESKIDLLTRVAKNYRELWDRQRGTGNSWTAARWPIVDAQSVDTVEIQIARYVATLPLPLIQPGRVDSFPDATKEDPK